MGDLSDCFTVDIIGANYSKNSDLEDYFEGDKYSQVRFTSTVKLTEDIVDTQPN